MRNILVLIALLLALSSCQHPNARRPIQSTSGSFINQSVERNKKLFEEETSLFREMMLANPEHDYIASKNGFWYYYNVKDSLASPQPKYGNRVTFKYNITDLNDNVILSEDELGLQDYIVDKTNQDLISGIRDGIKLMKEGESITFLFPSYKAYGYYGLQDKLGPNIPIQSTITLIAIKQIQENY